MSRIVEISPCSFPINIPEETLCILCVWLLPAVRFNHRIVCLIHRVESNSHLFFVLLCSIQMCEYITVCLSSLCLIHIWLDFSFWLLWMKLLCSVRGMCLGRHELALSQCYIWEQNCWVTEAAYVQLWCWQFSKKLYQFTFPPAESERSTFSPVHGTVSLLNFNHPDVFIEESHCGFSCSLLMIHTHHNCMNGYLDFYIWLLRI